MLNDTRDVQECSHQGERKHRMDGEELKGVQKFKYLGSIVDASGNMDEEVKPQEVDEEVKPREVDEEVKPREVDE